LGYLNIIIEEDVYKITDPKFISYFRKNEFGYLCDYIEDFIFSRQDAKESFEKAITFPEFLKDPRSYFKKVFE